MWDGYIVFMKKTAQQIEKAKKCWHWDCSQEKSIDILYRTSPQEDEKELSPRRLAVVLKRFFDKEELSIGWQVRLRHWLLGFFPEHARLMHHFMELSFETMCTPLWKRTIHFVKNEHKKNLLGFYQPTMINFCFGVWADFFGIEPPKSSLWHHNRASSCSIKIESVILSPFLIMTWCISLPETL